MKYYLNILLLILFGCTSAQKPPTDPSFQKVIPGADAMNASIIKPHKVRYKKIGGEMIYDLQKVERKGKEVYRLYVYFNDENGAPDIMYFDVETLGYLGRTLGSGEDSKYLLDVDFQDGKFTGDLIPKNDSGYTPRTYDKTYPHGAFEPAVINYFISALPLKKGYKASIPVFDLNDGSQMYWSNIEVLKKETIKANGKSYDTWKVLSKGIREKTIWVTETHPYAIKMKTKGNPGTWLVID
ncbi:MAG: DUF3108 domain-containing protein [Cyclobacteriaceae bacterium]